MTPTLITPDPAQSAEPAARPILGPLLYGLTFNLALPAVLVFWAMRTSPQISLPTPHAPVIGSALLALGLLLMLAAMRHLWRLGGGLPMNAYPPPALVTGGLYRLLPHPIYVGFCLACAGAAVAVGSPSGFWLVTPTVILACAALVLGHERLDLLRRFGRLPQTLLHLPADDPARPDLWDRLSLYALVFVPWLVLYELIGHFTPADAVVGYLPFERLWPVWQWTELVYVAAYPFVLMVPLLMQSRRDFREFAVRAWVGMAAGFLIMLLLPVLAPPRPFEPDGLLGHLLVLERAADDMIGGAFPSFHVFWALLAAAALARRFPRLAVLVWLWAALISLSCLTTGMHGLLDVVVGAALAGVSLAIAPLWRALLGASETIANSWREWRVGPLRIINHGFYAGGAAALGVGGIALVAGPGAWLDVAIVTLCSLTVAALWAQLIEGSPRLLRPFGYYGSLVGAAIGIAIISYNTSLWLMLGACTLVAPWVQAVGRLRCFVNGCCHGAKAQPHLGIRYTHPRSRVCRIAELAGAPVHPTQLYSILSNLVLGLLLLRLYLASASPAMIAGLYLLGSGLSRFVEEAYRGEPQTPIVARLRVYQWFAIASALLGLLVMMLPCRAPWPALHWHWPPLVLAATAFAVYSFAMGMDFPNSNARFARLT